MGRSADDEVEEEQHRPIVPGGTSANLAFRPPRAPVAVSEMHDLAPSITFAVGLPWVANAGSSFVSTYNVGAAPASPNVVFVTITAPCSGEVRLHTCRCVTSRSYP